MFSISHTVANILFGFKESGGSDYPCHYCGVLTTLLDAEDIHVCDDHQREYANLGYDAMKQKYPLAGKDERNPEFFKARTQYYLERARRLTKNELKLLIKRGCMYEQEYAQAILDGKTLEEQQMEWLGRSAKQYIDNWRG